jgi:hypothetical protein
MSDKVQKVRVRKDKKDEKDTATSKKEEKSAKLDDKSASVVKRSASRSSGGDAMAALSASHLFTFTATQSASSPATDSHRRRKSAQSTANGPQKANTKSGEEVDEFESLSESDTGHEPELTDARDQSPQSSKAESVAAAASASDGVNQPPALPPTSVKATSSPPVLPASVLPVSLSLPTLISARATPTASTEASDADPDDDELPEARRERARLFREKVRNAEKEVPKRAKMSEIRKSPQHGAIAGADGTKADNDDDADDANDDRDDDDNDDDDDDGKVESNEDLQKALADIEVVVVQVLCTFVFVCMNAIPTAEIALSDAQQLRAHAHAAAHGADNVRRRSSDDGGGRVVGGERRDVARQRQWQQHAARAHQVVADDAAPRARAAVRRTRQGSRAGELRR